MPIKILHLLNFLNSAAGAGNGATGVAEGNTVDDIVDDTVYDGADDVVYGAATKVADGVITIYETSDAASSLVPFIEPFIVTFNESFREPFLGSFIMSSPLTDTFMQVMITNRHE
ncbi:hypothetical protein [Paenibacillus assamensis]|uniref:hypothetical protein n=1 Tax=Paenibacillus assamensis TaxID=311244 RepID=UPI0012F8D1AB|nr:hypothetical protein [Paenibacillus assamensis]